MSTECERVFSSTGILLSDLRSTMDMASIKATECVKNWLRTVFADAETSAPTMSYTDPRTTNESDAWRCSATGCNLAVRTQSGVKSRQSNPIGGSRLSGQSSWRPCPTLKRQREDFPRSPSPPAERQREDSIRSPSLPPNRPTPIPDTTTTAFCDMEFSSSPTASTFRSSERSSSVSDDERLEGDHPEIDGTILIRNLIKRICEAHGDCHGYGFKVGYDVETLVIPICGDFPKSIPDLIVKMHKGRREYSIVDYEVCILYILILVSSSINLWLNLGQAIKDKDDQGGKVWARSCPSSWARQLDEGY
jgi:hypothetical protein